MSSQLPKVVIILDGGIVQEVYCDKPIQGVGGSDHHQIHGSGRGSRRMTPDYLPHPKPLPIPPRRRCTKVRYADKKSAISEARLRTMGRNRYRHNRPSFLRCYPCFYCQGWHLTHKDYE